MFGDVLAFLRTQYKPGPGQFLQIDPKVIVERIGLRERAAERAKANLPATDYGSMDEVEFRSVRANRPNAVEFPG